MIQDSTSSRLSKNTGPHQPAPGSTSDAQNERSNQSGSLLLLVSIFVIASCGLIYELLAGALSSYLLGNSLWQFSLVIGLFLSAMGIGSFLSRYFNRHLTQTFIQVEIWVGLIGGFLPLLLFVAFTFGHNISFLLVFLCLTVGTLVGLEIPLLVRILRKNFSLKAALGNVLSVDYLGALAASLLFPLVLVPELGMLRTGFLFGLLNVAVALVGIFVFRSELPSRQRLRLYASITAALLLAGFVLSTKATTLLESFLYDDQIIFAKTTPYQRLIVTRWRNDTRLFINGNIQFSSIDEFRYHESLVHPALRILPQPPKKVLLLGGGDGLGVREVLKHRGVEHIDLVDLDPVMTKIFTEVEGLSALSNHALRHKKVKVHNLDAQVFLEKSSDQWDAIIIDLPDPNNTSLGKLYSQNFYRLVAKHLTPTGVFVTQATSPFYATQAFWCIANTIQATTTNSESSPIYMLPYRASVPSFGEWGFVMGSLKPLNPNHIQLRDLKTRYLHTKLIQSLFVFPKDIGWRKTKINRLDNQVLIKYYEEGYRSYNYGKH